MANSNIWLTKQTILLHLTQYRDELSHDTATLNDKFKIQTKKH
jgi:hypothetical protein